MEFIADLTEVVSVEWEDSLKNGFKKEWQQGSKNYLEKKLL